MRRRAETQQPLPDAFAATIALRLAAVLVRFGDDAATKKQQPEWDAIGAGAGSFAGFSNSPIAGTDRHLKQSTLQYQRPCKKTPAVRRFKNLPQQRMRGAVPIGALEISSVRVLRIVLWRAGRRVKLDNGESFRH